MPLSYYMQIVYAENNTFRLGIKHKTKNKQKNENVIIARYI